MRWVLAMMLVVGSVLVGCSTSEAVTPARGEPLYFAVEVMKDGKQVAAPKLLGYAGHDVAAERRVPGAEAPDYQLKLKPRESGSGYRVELELALPSGKRKGSLSLLHGEERLLQLDKDVTMKVMLMRVDSDEFRALMAMPLPRGKSTI